MLTRADLPLDTVALAVCILDSLDAKFSHKWRLACPLKMPAPTSQPSPALVPPPPAEDGSFFPSHVKRHTVGEVIPSPLLPPAAEYHWYWKQLHIDSVHPELIILAALSIAHKFTVDDGPAAAAVTNRAHCDSSASASASASASSSAVQPGSARACCARWGRALWSPAQLNATERCIAESLGWRLLPLWDADVIAGARADMNRAARQQQATSRSRRFAAAADAEVVGLKNSGAHLRSMSTGVAVAGLGLQMTPAETPRPGVCGPTALLGEEVRAAFRGAEAALSPEALQLPWGLERRR